jgi:hypothetical protein
MEDFSQEVGELPQLQRPVKIKCVSHAFRCSSRKSEHQNPLPSALAHQP